MLLGRQTASWAGPLPISSGSVNLRGFSGFFFLSFGEKLFLSRFVCYFLVLYQIDTVTKTEAKLFFPQLNHIWAINNFNESIFNESIFTNYEEPGKYVYVELRF